MRTSWIGNDSPEPKSHRQHFIRAKHTPRLQGVRNFAAPARGPSQPRADPDQGSRPPLSQRRRAEAEHGCVKMARALYGTACNFSAPAGLSPRGCWFEPDNLKDRSAKQQDTCSREHLATGNVRVGTAGRYRFGSISLSGEIASGM